MCAEGVRSAEGTAGSRCPCADTDILVNRRTGNCVCSLRKQHGDLKEKNTQTVARIPASLRNSQDMNEAGVCQSSKKQAKQRQTAEAPRK